MSVQVAPGPPKVESRKKEMKNSQDFTKTRKKTQDD
jgi:hypothetical protein